MEEVKDFYHMLNEETGRLRELIDDVLDFSRMESGKLTLQKENLDLSHVTRTAYNRFQGKAAAHGFDVRMEIPNEPVPVLADRRAVIQAILNLLGNALKYSGAKREIRLSLQANGQWAAVTVRDEGIGISDEEKNRVFEKFYRSERALNRQREGGVGLGLAIVRHIMEGHGGKVTLESNRGKGSIFSLWFPKNGATKGVSV